MMDNEVKDEVERLQKVLSQAGIASRRKSEELIQQGRVSVNGVSITSLGSKVDPKKDQIEVDGELINREKKVYYMFYKPSGVITSLSDPQGRKVVTDYLTEVRERVFPIGRLDYQTSGLLLLTNDGNLAHHLMHPSFEIDKSYIATVEGIPSEQEMDRLRKGVELDDGLTSPAQVKMLRSDRSNNQAVIQLIIHEGRNRQVRRMCAKIGYPVLHLHRDRYGFFTLDGLLPGQYRPLSEDELSQLKGLLVT